MAARADAPYLRGMSGYILTLTGDTIYRVGRPVLATYPIEAANDTTAPVIAKMFHWEEIAASHHAELAGDRKTVFRWRKGVAQGS
jgi:hypothetical protein